MPNEIKQKAVSSLKDKIKQAKSIVFADYLGLKAGDMNSLRAKMKEQGAEVVVSKNTLMKVALGKGHQAEKDLEGPTMAVFSLEDPIAPIKTLFDFAKKLELPKVKAAIIDGTYNTATQVEIIKDLPSKEVLLGRLLGAFQSPIRGFTTVTKGVQSKFVFAIKAIADKK